MEPKTALQKQVVILNSKLPGITDAQTKWAIKKCFKAEGFYRAKKIWCLECGNVFDAKGSNLSYSLLGAACPCCGKHLKVTDSRKRKYSPTPEYFTLITTIQGFQVLRHYVASKSCRVGEPARYGINEAVQNWVSPKGIEVIMSRLSSYCHGCYDHWSWGSPMEVRQDSCFGDKYHIWANHIKTLRLLPRLKYVGIDKNYYGITPDVLFRMLVRYPFVETLIKQGDRVLLNYMGDHVNQVGKYWPSLKIARRHGYKIKNYGDYAMYFDYLEMTHAVGRDIRSPKYLCPANLRTAHDEVMAIKRKLDAKAESEKKRKQALQNETLYQEQKSRFLDIVFGDGLIRIHVLQSVAEFMEEGDEMHHCVFTNEYFKRPDSLILSARIDGKRIETVEISLRTFDIVQSRGAYNKNTKYHDQIISLVKENIGLIRRKTAA